jgi:deoxyribodipyrimidine photo-lyase
MTRPVRVLWFRRDLRLHDHLALQAAAAGADVLALFVVDPALWEPAGAPRRAFLVGCLESLQEDIGGHLVIRHGDPVTVVAEVARQAQAEAVYVSADFGPYGRRRDALVQEALGDIALRRVGSPYAVDPGAVAKADGSPYRVFTPFSREWRHRGWPPPAPRPRVSWVEGTPSDKLPDTPGVGAQGPVPGEEAARRRWRQWRERDGGQGYGPHRNEPAADATSHMSVYLKWGCLHPRTLLADLGPSKSDDVYRNELCWREFYADVLWHHPESARRALQPHMANMQLDRGAEADERFRAWTEGRTGYPIVDAGMRQLLAQGWMHNRVRMIVASFLVKDLHIDWGRGARWFLEHLVDGDLASNNHGWQWVAGTGTDAAPYFRIFNPTSQGEKFDPDGSYVRRWVPELADVEAKFVHRPWEAAQLPVSAAAYPDPIVDHGTERQEALRRYGALRP